jgi:hypothetical protein
LAKWASGGKAEIPPQKKPLDKVPPAAKAKAEEIQKPHSRGTISGDASEGDLTGIAGDVVKPSGEVLSKVIHAFASIGFTAEMLEADGKHDDATKLVQEIQIETYGSLQTVEKVDFILYQMKLVLGRRDFVRCQILSRKISKKHINEKGLER